MAHGKGHGKREVKPEPGSGSGRRPGDIRDRTRGGRHLPPKPTTKSSEGVHKSAVKDVPTKVLENELQRRTRSTTTPKGSAGIHKSAVRKTDPGRPPAGAKDVKAKGSRGR
jgi:hypothetical protein